MKNYLTFILLVSALGIGSIAEVQADCDASECSFCTLPNGKPFREYLGTFGDGGDYDTAKIKDQNKDGCSVWNPPGTNDVYGCRHGNAKACNPTTREIDVSCQENNTPSNLRRIKSSSHCEAYMKKAFSDPIAGVYDMGVGCRVIKSDGCKYDSDYDEYDCTLYSDTCMPPIQVDNNNNGTGACPPGYKLKTNPPIGQGENTAFSVCKYEGKVLPGSPAAAPGNSNSATH